MKHQKKVNSKCFTKLSRFIPTHEETTSKQMHKVTLETKRPQKTGLRKPLADEKRGEHLK